MEGFKPQDVINGTWGELWIDDEYMAEAISVKAEVTGKYTAVTRIRNLMDGQKLTGLEGKGDIKLHKVTSRLAKKISDAFKAGKTPVAMIKTKLSDPDNGGVENVALYGCVFDKAVLADWEAGKNLEESYSFTFEDWDFLDAIL